ncbi:unnamed protein product [Clonostachys chloroleuca]|uniref:HPt domain-containing protein n=1 Tax=Clonostachys chloroleuca TaxID=1926264 RepID=A0AA35VPR8_9HYPO|nr:unnamed protein product [Clonostachys chloroleuca]
MATKVSEKCPKQVLNIQVFAQILEMDEDLVEREFSSEIVLSFFEETQKILASMEEELEQANFPTLACLGEYVRGSAATLGLEKISESGRKIHCFGFRRTEDGSFHEGDDSLSLGRIRSEIAVMRHELVEARKALNGVYELKGNGKEGESKELIILNGKDKEE